MNSASLCSLTGRYDNPIPTRFLAPIDCLKKFQLRIPLAALLVGDGLLHGEEVDDGAEGAEGQTHQADEAGHQQQGPLHRHRGQDEQARQQRQRGQDVVLGQEG